MNIEELKKQLSIRQKLLDLFRQLLGLQTELDKMKIKEMIVRIAKEEGVDEKLLLAVIECENRKFDTKAINKNSDGTFDYGLCQFNSKWYIEKMKLITVAEALDNPEKAVRVMAKRFKEGWAKDWVCYSTKKYISYLKV